MQTHINHPADSTIPALDPTHHLISSVASRADFGFTAGASPALMSCIIETTQLSSLISQRGGLSTHQTAISQLYQRLQACSYPKDSPGQYLVRLHHRIFQLGAIVYFHRSIWDSRPNALIPYIEELLQAVKEYQQLGGGYVTLWPVFITAVEVYLPQHKLLVREWLNECETMGAASRKDIRELIEAVWRKRLEIRQHMGGEMEQGEIVVEWRGVMWEKQLDILLV